jgi:hypothetical protein
MDSESIEVMSMIHIIPTEGIEVIATSNDPVMDFAKTEKSPLSTDRRQQLRALRRSPDGRPKLHPSSNASMCQDGNDNQR